MPKRREKSASTTAAAPERVYVPISDAQDAPRTAAEEIEVLDRDADLDVPAPSHEAPHGPSISKIFGPGGMLEKCMPQGYEHRPSQLEMAKLLEKAFASQQHAIVEAGTGTGKTLAYLIPAIRSGRRIVISTATKSLQEQLFTKDIPFLQRHFAPDLKVAVMKGRNNFLCRQKSYWMADQQSFRGLDEMDWFRENFRLGKTHRNRRPRRADFLPDDAELWHQLDARRDIAPARVLRIQ